MSLPYPPRPPSPPVVYMYTANIHRRHNSCGSQAQSDGSKLKSSIGDLSQHAHEPLSRLLTQALVLASHGQDLEAGQATQVVVLRLRAPWLL